MSDADPPYLSSDTSDVPQSSMLAELTRDLETLRRAGLYRTLRHASRRQGVTMVLDHRPTIDFGSNDYLGLAGDPRLASIIEEFLVHEATGAAAARLISGNHPVHTQLEAELAAFKRTEAALLFSSGYMANVGAIPALVGKRDVVYADELNHASLIDAVRMSRAESRVFPHNDVTALRHMLQADAGKFRRRLIVVDGMFSMDGEVFPLDALVPVAREFDAWTYVDDAHGTAVLGAEGRGALEYRGVEGQIDVVMGTLGKALGTAGAFVAGSSTLIEFLRHRARSFVFTTGSPPALAAAAREALRIARDEPWRREALHANARRLRAGLRALGHPGEGSEDSYIVPVRIGPTDKTVRIGELLRDAGYLVGAVRPPTVPMGTSRLRITVSAAHTVEHIDGLLAKLGPAFATLSEPSVPSVVV
jgi:8-amino-7-oxononanoate synthase